MATTKDTYVLEIIDKILKPLQAIEKQATAVNNTLERLEKLAAGGVGLAKMAAGVGLAIGGLMALKTAAGAALGILEKCAEGAVEFGKSVVDATRFRSQNISGLDLFLGAGKGEGVFNKALEFGKYLPMDEREVVKQVRELAAAGYQGKRLEAVNAALADVQALQGDASKDNLLFHFKRLQNEAKPDAKDVKMAAIDTGVGMAGIFREIYRAQGMALPADAKSTKGLFKMEEQYEKWKRAGKVSGQDVADAILRAIQDRYDGGGGLGTAAVERGDKTLGGLLSNLKAAPERFLMQMQLERMPGIRSVMDFIKRLLVFFDHATPQGQRLTAVVEKMVNTLFGGLERIGPEDMKRIFEAGVRQAERLVKLVESITGKGGVLDQLLHGDFSGLAAAAGGAIFEVGKFLGMGIWEGFKLAIGGQLAKIPGAQEVVVPSAKGITGAARGMNAVYSTTGTQIGREASVGLSQSIESILPGIRGAWQGAQGAFGSVGRGFEGAWAGMTGRHPELEQRGAEIPLAVRKGMDDASQRHSPPALFVEAGEEYAEAILMGLQRRMAALKTGGEHDTLLDHFVEFLQGSALRVGA